MVGLSEQIRTLEAAREIYKNSPSHAPALKTPEEGTFCVISAIGEARGSYFFEYEELFYEAIGVQSIVIYNAEHTTEEVLALFDQVISELKAKCSVLDVENSLDKDENVATVELQEVVL